ncbi:MAG: Hpt domain-containing protein [Deltaproteobacteria bacterium]|nr:Hpt domain-containing protein [Deltaproteobacteria bacterium]
MLDLAVIGSIRALRRPGHPDVLQTLVDMFLVRAPADLDRLMQAIEASDCDTARKAAHKLKGGCRSLGAMELGAMLGEVETAAASGAVAEMRRLALSLPERSARAIEALRHEGAPEPARVAAQ